MVEYDNTDRGVLFKNKDKDGSESTDKFPNYKGNINVEGKEFWLSAWINESRDGMKYMTLRVKAKESRARAREQTKEEKREEFNDEIPF